MKIGIVVHSSTGNTLSVAQKLKEKLITAGHSVYIEQLTPVGGEKTNETNISNIRFEKQPDVSTYDALIFSCPVRGASMSLVLKAYLSQLVSLKNKKTACLVTEAFPFPWMGGTRAISQIKEICESKGTSILGAGIVNWMGKQREKRISDVVDMLSKVF